jgi:ubiquinone/menaquinone biosynthesis C-methylase UbiE
MLRVCKQKLTASGLSNWQVEVADHRKLPVEDASADLVVSGWSVSVSRRLESRHMAREVGKWLAK